MRRKLFAGLALLPLAGLLALTACGKNNNDDKKADKPADKTDDTGWTPLFNGKNLDGWVIHPEDKAR
jgi:hypothetical protein